MDIIDKAIDEMPVMGSFYDLDALACEMFDRAMKISQNTSESITVECQCIGKPDHICYIEIPSGEFVESAIDGQESGNQYGNLCGLVEQKSAEFHTQGHWQYGFCEEGNDVLINRADWPTPVQRGKHIEWVNNGIKYFPILWFGISNQPPEKIWTLGGPDFDAHALEFWQSELISEEMILPDSRNPYGMGYWLAECGCHVPDTDDIRARCPIEIGINDSVQDILNRINDFFLAQFSSRD